MDHTGIIVRRLLNDQTAITELFFRPSEASPIHPQCESYRGRDLPETSPAFIANGQRFIV
jgi:hypothetical protein